MSNLKELLRAYVREPLPHLLHEDEAIHIGNAELEVRIVVIDEGQEVRVIEILVQGHVQGQTRRRSSGGTPGGHVGVLLDLPGDHDAGLTKRLGSTPGHYTEKRC